MTGEQVRGDPGDDDDHRIAVVPSKGSHCSERQRLAALHVAEHQACGWFRRALRRDALAENRRRLGCQPVLAVSIEKQVIEEVLHFRSLERHPEAAGRKLVSWRNQFAVVVW